VKDKPPRCRDCRWARALPVNKVPGAKSAGKAEPTAIYCHVDRPCIQVDPESFCPVFEARVKSAPA